MKIGQDIKWLLSLRTSGVPGDRGNGEPKKLPTHPRALLPV